MVLKELISEIYITSNSSEGVCLARTNRRDLVSRLENNGDIHEMGEISVEDYDKINKLIKDYDYAINNSKIFGKYHNDIYYGAISEKYSAKDIYIFSFIANMSKQYNYHSAITYSGFLSALINIIPEKDFFININDINEIDFTNFIVFNKNITFIGDVGDNFGFENFGNNLFLKGNCKKQGGIYIKGGTITINGNSDDFLGSNMKRGKIIVNGNCSYCVGYNMKGGEIHLNGEYISLDKTVRPGKGTIYHNGIKIIENGKETGLEKVKWH